MLAPEPSFNDITVVPGPMIIRIAEGTVCGGSTCLFEELVLPSAAKHPDRRHLSW